MIWTYDLPVTTLEKCCGFKSQSGKILFSCPKNCKFFPLCIVLPVGCDWVVVEKQGSSLQPLSIRWPRTSQLISDTKKSMNLTVYFGHRYESLVSPQHKKRTFRSALIKKDANYGWNCNWVIDHSNLCCRNYCNIIHNFVSRHLFDH
mgnify:CR=1 FL=1